MTMTATASAGSRATSWRRWALPLLAFASAVPSLLGLVFWGGLLAGPLGFVAPFSWLALVFLYRMVVESTTTTQGRAVSREIGAGALGIALAFGTYVVMLFVGIAFDVVPFIASGPYPYADDWTALSVVVSIASAAAAWWLLRRWADRAADRASA
jgi:hypothetical protein